jgi:hypothetical protein
MRRSQLHAVLFEQSPRDGLCSRDTGLTQALSVLSIAPRSLAVDFLRKVTEGATWGGRPLSACAPQGRGSRPEALPGD